MAALGIPPARIFVDKVSGKDFDRPAWKRLAEKLCKGDAAPFIADDRAMVPLRVIAEALGADIYWDGDTRTVRIVRGANALSLVIDAPLPDGLGTAIIKNDRTFVPTRYVSEMLGASVRWDGETRAVYVY